MRNEGRDYEHPALSEARRAAQLRKGPVTEADVPPPSLFPATKASTAAKALHKRKGRVQP